MTEFERPRYFAGKLLTAEDFELEQSYQIEKRRLLNHLLHGSGIISGLEVVPGEPGTVTVAPGFALDAHGREILVTEPQSVALPDTAEPISVSLLYAEVETERTTIRETFQLVATTAALPQDAVVLAVVEDGVIDAGES